MARQWASLLSARGCPCSSSQLPVISVPAFMSSAPGHVHSPTHMYTYIWIIQKQMEVSFKRNFFFYIRQREPNQKINGFKQKPITLNFDERILRLISLFILLQSIRSDFVTQETQSIWSRLISLWALHIFSTERKQWSSGGHDDPVASCHIGPQRHQQSVAKHLENTEVDLHRSHWTG